jgi:hypothetical protein
VGGKAWLLAALALGVCLAIRLVYFTEYARALPFLWGPVGDSIVYLEQAAHVLRGEHGDATLLAFSPLYGYALALLGAPFDPVTAAVLQLLSGVFVSGILFVTVYRLSGNAGDGRAALITGLMFSLYGGALFLESKIPSRLRHPPLGPATSTRSPPGTTWHILTRSCSAHGTTWPS